MFEAGVKCVIKEPITSRYVMMIETICGQYLVPITIGTFEAEAIYQELNRIPSPRPMTHQFVGGILSVLDGVNVESVTIDNVDRGVFTAKLRIFSDGKSKIIDCRPSDGVALALHMSIPLFIEEQVVSKSCCIERTGLTLAEERALFGIIDDQGTSFWNV
jgi:bifunctional DNase/RNase